LLFTEFSTEHCLSMLRPRILETHRPLHPGPALSCNRSFCHARQLSRSISRRRLVGRRRG
jgi:hypothetical protein